VTELAANVVLFNLIAFLFQFPLGMSFAVGIGMVRNTWNGEINYGIYLLFNSKIFLW
jgi:hypothetical protein